MKKTKDVRCVCLCWWEVCWQTTLQISCDVVVGFDRQSLMAKNLRGDA
jgi:hypothetical protein